jgi:hypothetical protein
VGLAALIIAIAGAPSVEATVVGVLPEGLLTEQARLIVIGEVIDISSHWDPGQGQILTDITVRLDEVLKGAIPTPELTIRQLGGKVGDVESRVEGSPEFRLGERVLLFLTTRGDGTLRTAHLYLGKFSILTDLHTGERFARRQTPAGVVVTTPRGSGARPTTDELHRLRDIRDRIRGAVRGRLGLRGATAPLFTPPAPVGTTEAQESFTFLGTPSRWFEPDTGAPVTMLLNAEGEPRAPGRGFDQVGAAYAAWSSVSGSSFRYHDGGTTTTVGHRRDGVSTVSFGDPLGQMDDPVNCGGVLAMGGYFSTSAQRRMVNGQTFNRIVEGDVVVNRGWDGCGFYERFANLAEVVTHELGHVLGLGHSSDSDATMAPRAHFDGRGASLRADDSAGLRFVYPGAAAGGSDLVVEALAVSPSSLAPGAGATVSYAVANRGTLAVSGTYGERIYLSTNTTLDAADILLMTTAPRSTPLAPNATVSLSQPLTIPASTAAGTHFIIVQTDEAAGVTESNETNNVAATSLAVQPSPAGAPDLVVSALSAAGSVAVGTGFSVNDTTRNQGTAASGASTTRFFLSRDTILDPGDVVLGHRAVGALAAGGASSGSSNLAVPATTTAGSYHVLAQADAAGGMAESSESNNVTAVALTVTPSSAGGELILDNAPAGTQDTAGGRTFSGRWCTSSAPGPFGGTSLQSCGFRRDTYRWTPRLAAAGTYDVYVWWTASQTRSSQVPITVTHTGGSTTRRFNQRTEGGRWQLHGRYTFGAGTAGSVSVSDANGQAAADAVRFVRIH